MLEVNNLSIGYEGRTVADNINFHVNEGDYLCIVGENGAGKSTLVKTLLHLTKPLSGEIVFKEGGIGYLPQQTVVQKDFPASVWEIVLSGNLSHLGFKPFYTSHEKAAARKNMERMSVWELRRSCFRNLSGGQQQRVLLARAMCASDRMLILDEPVSGLDPKVTSEFYDLTKKLNESGITIIMVSHDLRAVIDYSSHILHIGRDDIYYGTTKEYLSSSFAANLGFCLNGEDN